MPTRRGDEHSVLIATTALSVHALITHSEELDFPSFFIFVTPRSHTLHHAKNPRYIDKNFGAMLCVWDRLFRTHVAYDPSDPPVYGTAHGYGTHNGVKAQWVLWQDLLARIRVEGVRAAFSRPKAHAPSAPAPSPSRRAQLVVALAFVALVPFALWIFVLRDEHSLGLRLLASTAIMLGLFAGGARLDYTAKE